MSVTWQAAMITPDRDLGSAPLLRALFAVEDGHGEVVRATLHASARGVFEAVLGGRPVADDVTITVIVTGRSSGKITRKNIDSPVQPSIIAASSICRGIVATKARNSRMLNGAR